MAALEELTQAVRVLTTALVGEEPKPRPPRRCRGLTSQQEARILANELELFDTPWEPPVSGKKSTRFDQTTRGPTESP